MIKVFFTLVFFAQSVFAANYFHDKDLPIPKGVKVKIIKYERVADGVFKGFIVGADGEGPFYTRAEHLAKSVKGIEFREAHKSGKKLVGKTFLLSKKLETVVPPPIVRKKVKN